MNYRKMEIDLMICKYEKNLLLEMFENFFV